MEMRLHVMGLLISLVSVCACAQETDSLIYAEGTIINAETREPVTARIVYESLPYGNRIGVINNNAYSFPMFGRDHYSITVEAPGFKPVKYMLDPNAANDYNKVIRDIELSAGERRSPHTAGEVLRLDNLIFEVGKSKIAPESFSELDILVNLMKENPQMIIQLEGHTDFLGESRANMKLSQQRVESVKDYVTDKALPKAE